MIDLDPDLDLRIERVIHSPRARVWKAWTDPLDLARHEQLAFADGWGTVTEQLAAIAEAEDGRR